MKSNNGNFKILIVDDSDETIETLSNILKKEHYDVSFASSGEEALGLLKFNEYDLILLDVKMPEMNGFEVFEEMKRNEKTKDIPVIFISQFDDDESIVKGLNMGGRDFITKDTEPVVILARVNTHLELHSSSRKKLLAANEELKAKNEELKKVNDQKKDFIKLAAENLLNCLTPVMGNTELLKMKYGKDAELPMKLDRIEQSSEKMKELIDEILDKAANDSGIGN
jgi:two-component system sensor histidine kinase/response regulator